MHTPAVASRFGTNSDTVRRRLFSEQPSGSSSAVPTRGSFGPHGLDAPPEGGQASQPVAGGGGGPNQLPPPPLPQSPLAKAAGYVNNALTGDEQYPELDQYCKREFLWIRLTNGAY